MPENPHVPDGVAAAGTFPTTFTDWLCRLICQIGQGAVPDPPVYKLRTPSPVNPSMARGKVTRVVKVAWHQFFNASLSRSTRWFSVTDLPQLLRQWASEDFIFNNPYDFTDRYAGGADYFTAEAKLYKGRVWETNFIPDIKKLPLYEWKSRGGGGTNAFMVMGAGMMESHVSRFESGHYKKAHRHGPGAHLYITEGEGYVLTQRGNEPRIRCDWQEGSLYLSGAGEGLWLHQHFNVGPTPATYLVMNQGISRKHCVNRWQANESTVLRQGEVSSKKGGHQVEYEDEDPEIHDPIS